MLILSQPKRYLTAHGQSNASIQGEALDQNGASISGITIRLRSEAIGLERTTVTDSEGRYYIAALPVGDYQLESSGQGIQAGLPEQKSR